MKSVKRQTKVEKKKVPDKKEAAKLLGKGAAKGAADKIMSRKDKIAKALKDAGG